MEVLFAPVFIVAIISIIAIVALWKHDAFFIFGRCHNDSGPGDTWNKRIGMNVSTGIGFMAIFILCANRCVNSNTKTNQTTPSTVATDSIAKDSLVTDTTSITDADVNNCPVQGNANSINLRDLNILKNRSVIPKIQDFNSNVTLTALLEKGNDITRWSNTSAAKITGYVRDVKVGGIETTNCDAKDKAFRDTHIELVLDPMTAQKNECIIVEITPRLRKMMASQGQDWSTQMIRSKYLGRWVEVEGWMLYDYEHANMAENTHPGNIKNWRGSAWEIHPITEIKIAENH
jgi:hypothetical protein